MTLRLEGTPCFGATYSGTGHPEVYVLSYRPLAYLRVLATARGDQCSVAIYALAGIGVVAFIVYGHHMFTSGMSPTPRFVTMLTPCLCPYGNQDFQPADDNAGGRSLQDAYTLGSVP